MKPTEAYELWLEKLEKDDPMRSELLAIRDNETEITDRFYQTISFGTAGLRGICGAGSNRMNELTVGRATAGIGDYILSSGEDIQRGVVFAYDCRYNSKEFSELAAQILAAKGIKVYLFPSLRPTPELSYAIRKLGAVSGVNMTASHNPKEYNGYKVYWKDGAQISGEVSDKMSEKINALDLFSKPEKISLKEAEEKGLLVWLGEDMDNDYLDYVKSMSVLPDEELDKSVPFVYTPLNGAGSIPIKKLFSDLGYTGFNIVEEQEDPDPEFTTVGYPNPEDTKAFALSEKLGKKVGAEVLIATDPDADRMAIEVRDENGEYAALNGNQTGALLIAYMAENLKKTGRLKEKSALIKSIVTGDMGRAVCEVYGISTFEALTGFKNICGKIPELEKKGYSYFFAYEESIGSAPGEEVRDKDGITAAMLIAELAANLRKKGSGILKWLDELYKQYGYFAESQYSLVLKGEEGSRKIAYIMEEFRNNAPKKFGEFEVEKTVDYISGYEDIPASNVLKFILKDGSWFACRPSGTEPKLKFYFYTKKNDKKDSEDAITGLREAVLNFIGKV